MGGAAGAGRWASKTRCRPSIPSPAWTIHDHHLSAWLFNQTSGSVLHAFLMHAATDTMFILVSPPAESNDITAGRWLR
ncbi:MAG: hypothetical protein R2911_41025 [Caldilineaceae bacterium]